MKLIFVHGRGQGGAKPELLKTEWMTALASGLAHSIRSVPVSTDVQFPFFGDRLDELVSEVEAPLAADINAKGSVTTPHDQVRAALLESIAVQCNVTPLDIAIQLGGEPLEKGIQNWAWIQATIAALDRISGLNTTLLDLFTRDVSVYLAYTEVRYRIDAVVEAAIGDEACVVVGHSLGSVVAYNVLKNKGSNVDCLRYITVGSPLGIRAVQHYLTTPLRSPAGVRNWYNAYDKRDVVALRPLDAVNFNIVPPVENTGHVENSTENHHGISGYLSDARVAEKIAEYLI